MDRPADGRIKPPRGQLGMIAMGALLVVCGAVIVCGFGLLERYAATPGKPGIPQKKWPAQSSIPRPDTLPTLIMLAHPKCPCTRSSIDELAVVMRHCAGRVNGFVAFFRPGDAPEGWEQTDLWRSAAAIPGIKVISDINGREAQRFGAATSGSVVLYDQTGRLRFSGGITRSRGMSGESDGRKTVIALITGESSILTATPVYGCQLLDSTDQTDTCMPGNEERPCNH